MKVTMLTHTPEPERTVACAAKLCYSKKVSISSLWESLADYEEVEKFLTKLIANGHCYDEKTEVLTSKGFIPWKYITSDSKLAVIDPSNGEFVDFEYPSILWHKHVDNIDMISYDTRDVDLHVTLGHNLYCSLSNTVKTRLSPSFELIPSDTLVNYQPHNNDGFVCDKPMRMKTYATMKYIPKNEYDLLYALYGFFIGDGHASRANKSGYIGFHLRKERKINYLKDLCSKLGLELKLTTNGTYNIYYDNIGYLFRKLFYNDASEKTFPTWFLTMSQSQYNFFIDGLKNSDGSIKRNTFVYCTTSKELADRIQALASIHGDTIKLTINSMNVPSNHKSLYRLNFNSVGKIPHLNDSRFDTSYCNHYKYTGDVYCATVSTGLLVVRRNNKVALCGNCSPLEHISFTFAIEDVSRATLAQLSRHRIGISLSVRSQRYCNEGEFKAIPPKEIENNKEALDEFNMLMEQLKCEYNYLQYKYSLSNEDARAILPNACATRMIVTMNARELLHFFNERCCTRAQNEIRTLAYKMLALCKSIAPIIFENAGAKCDTLGYCPESNMSCGKKPTLDKIMEVYNANV